MVTFNNKDIFSDYGFILSKKDLGSASPKIIRVDVLGGDGTLDLTDFFGEANYNNRTMTFVFSKCQNKVEFLNEWSELQNELVGKKVNIILDEDLDWFYSGRIESMVYTRDRNITTITVSVIADPWKLKTTDTVESIQGNGTLVINNTRKTVVPKVTTTAETQIVFGTKTVNLSAGTVVVPELELLAGSNSMTITSTGTTTFTFREGAL